MRRERRNRETALLTSNLPLLACVSRPAQSEYRDTKHGSIRLRRQLASHTKHPIFSCLHDAVKRLLLEAKLLLRIKSLGVPPGEHDQQSCVHPSYSLKN